MTLFKHGLIKDHTILTRLSYFIFDLIVMFLGCLFASKLKFHQWLYMPQSYENFFILAVAISLFVFFKVGLYQPMRITSFYRLSVKVIISWFLLAAILSLLAFFTKTGATYSRVWMMWWLIVSASLHFFGRIFLLLSLRCLRKRGLNQRSVLLIGNGDFVMNVRQRVFEHQSSGFTVTKCLAVGECLTLDGDLDPLISKELLAGKYDQIWIAIPLSCQEEIKAIIQALQYSMVDVSIVPDMFGLDLLNHSMGEVAGIPFINLSSSPLLGLSRFLKRVEDLVLSVIILLMLSPFMLVIAFTIKMTSPGPILYRQKRVTSRGVVFSMLKFRSMPVGIENHSGAVWAKKDEARATRFGAILRKTSLDELPQFFNVLSGKMSIVGPRPERPEFVDQFKHSIPRYMKKHFVKAGITGLAQIKGFRGDTDLSKRVDCDLDYINHWSLWLDIKIIFLTIFKVFSDKNAY